MCIAGLYFSTQPCAHGWHELIRPCRPNNNLANCKNKLKLEGWAVKTDSCPWCDVDAPIVTDAAHKLLGGGTSSSRCSSTPSSPVIPALSNVAPTPKRMDSFGTMSSLFTPLSRHSSAGSSESERGSKHRAMNDRINRYLTSNHRDVLPSAAKNSPTFPGRQSVDVRRSVDVQQQQLPPVLERSNSKRLGGIMTRTGRLRRKMNMSVFGF